MELFSTCSQPDTQRNQFLCVFFKRGEIGGLGVGGGGTKQLGLAFYSIPDPLKWKFSSAAHSAGELSTMESLCLANVKLLPYCEKPASDSFLGHGVRAEENFLTLPAQSHTAAGKATALRLKKGLATLPLLGSSCRTPSQPGSPAWPHPRKDERMSVSCHLAGCPPEFCSAGERKC